MNVPQNVLVIGSEGFIGQALVERLLADDTVGRVTLLDRRITPRSDPRVLAIEGDLCDRATLERAAASGIGGGVDKVFHLASIPGGAAEQDFELGLKVNLVATIELLEVLRRLGTNPRFVFCSTIGIYGVPMPDVIDEQTVPEPSLSYGAHKYIGEVLVADYGRRGFVNGVSVRLPGIVARPHAEGMLSMFLSNIIREPAAGRPFVCPVAADAPGWWMSRPQMVDNLLHAATLPPEVLDKRRTFLMPVLRLTMEQIVDGVSEAYRVNARELVSYAPDDRLQALFANYPPMLCPDAHAAGFRNDGNAIALVTRALL